MNTAHLQELPYSADTCQLFEKIRELPHAVFLDSAHPHTLAGRFDILTADPMQVTMPSLPAAGDSGEAIDFYQQLKALHKSLFGGITSVHADIPFCGGIAGYIGYDSGNALHRVAAAKHTPAAMAATSLHAYNWCVIQDHLLQRAVLVTLPSVSAGQRRDLYERLLHHTPELAKPFVLQRPFTADISRREYDEAFARIKAYLISGDSYQVNLAQRFSAEFEGDAWLAYKKLRPIAAAPYSGYLEQADGSSLLCLSPERFLATQGKQVITSPIKGTRPRDNKPEADAEAAQALRLSAKDRAENLMIVDLLRNDLGRCCVPGSVRVERLFEIQSFATVHHLVSTISGELSEDMGPWDVLLHSFPGGSITGAPKRRAMEIIAELEPFQREAYCGSMLYVSACGRMDSNIAIRSLAANQGQLRCWAGGGIVADSQCDAEYQETWDKVGKLLAALESTD